MLSHPTDFPRSVQAGNIDNSLFLDWLETSSLFLEEDLSQTDIVDYLVEEQLLEFQTDASDYVLSAWDALTQRLSWLGSHSPIGFQDRRIVKKLDWKQAPAYSFCLVVSFGSKHEDWHREFGPDYTDQGRLFELITKASMEARFSGWRFLHTGWRKDNTSKLVSVGNLIQFIDEREGIPNDYLSQNAKDAGIDLVWHFPFADRRGGAPVYLAQCASGKYWEQKTSTPNINDWSKIIDFAVKPSKAFSLPFSLSDKELRLQSNRAQALFIDRSRLLAHSVAEDEWVPDSLRFELIDWLKPRIAWIMDK